MHGSMLASMRMVIVLRCFLALALFVLLCMQLPCPKLTVDRLELERGFTYQEGGLDWDNSTWSCLTGILQSPINFPSPQGMTP